MKRIVRVTRTNLTSVRDMSPVRGTQDVFFNALLSGQKLAVVAQADGDLHSFLRNGDLGNGISISSTAKKALDKARALAGRISSTAVIAGGICGLVEDFGKETAKPGEGILVTAGSNGTSVSYAYTMGVYDGNKNARVVEILDTAGTSIAKPSEGCRASPILRVSALIESISTLGPEPVLYQLESGADSLNESIDNLLKAEGSKDQLWFYVGFGVCTVEARVWTKIFSGPRFMESLQPLPAIKGPSIFIGYIDPGNEYEANGHTHSLTRHPELGLTGGHTVRAYAGRDETIYLIAFPVVEPKQ